jgi:hypothetical protein
MKKPRFTLDLQSVAARPAAELLTHAAQQT